MAEFREYIRERGLATVARRGSDGKSYEGVYARDGNWKFPDCSEFEVKVATVVQDELFKNPMRMKNGRSREPPKRSA